MKIKKIIEKIASYLQLEDILEYFKALREYESGVSETQPELTSDISSQLDFLVEIINNVNLDIASNYIPLKNIEEITVEDNEFNLSNLVKPLNKIIKVIKNGLELKFCYLSNKLKTANGKVKILYTYFPEEKSLNDEIEDYMGRVSLLTFTYGACSEYCLVKGDYEQAMVWDERYKDNLLSNARKVSNFYIKKRRWI